MAKTVKMSNFGNEKEFGRRVVITGMGLVSAAGLTLEDLWTNCQMGKSSVRPCQSEGKLSSFLRYAAPADEFTGDIANFGVLEDSFKKAIRKGLKLMSREIQIGVASAQRALHDAGVSAGTLNPERTGVSFASDYIITTPDEVAAGMTSCTQDGKFDFSRWAQEGLPKMTPVWQLKFLPNMPASHICIFNQFRGPCNAITGREASIGMAVGEAVEVIRAGKSDVMLVGATGSRLHPFKLIHALFQGDVANADISPEAVSRPFDPGRCGMVLGEGAGALLLEDEEHALRRGARIYAEVVGGTYRTRNSHYLNDGGYSPGNLPVPNIEESLVSSMTSLFKRLEITPGDIDSISAGSFSSRELDVAEARAIRRVFGDMADRVPVTSVKGNIGNPGAGGGAIDLILSVLALQNGVLCPILNNEADDEACPICPVRTNDVPAGNSFVKLAYERFGQSSAVFVRKI